MSDTFTQGAWSFGFCENPYMNTTYEISVGDQSVAGVWLEKDAQLIAAAPDLYDAARDTVLSMIMGGYSPDHPVVKKLESALKKARGEV